LTDIGFEKDSDYSKTSLTGRVNVLKVEAFKNVYESLMEHVIMHGIDIDVDKAKLLLKLFNNHAAITDLLKVSLCTSLTFLELCITSFFQIQY
jgi:hypothetical protein